MDFGLISSKHADIYKHKVYVTENNILILFIISLSLETYIISVHVFTSLYIYFVIMYFIYLFVCLFMLYSNFLVRKILWLYHSPKVTVSAEF